MHADLGKAMHDCRLRVAHIPKIHKPGADHIDAPRITARVLQRRNTQFWITSRICLSADSEVCRLSDTATGGDATIHTSMCMCRCGLSLRESRPSDGTAAGDSQRHERSDAQKSFRPDTTDRQVRNPHELRAQNTLLPF
jgi:hypothetical protein